MPSCFSELGTWRTRTHGNIHQQTFDYLVSQEVDGGDREAFGTLQAKKRALLGQKDRLKLLKKMQSGKERVQRKMDRGRSSGTMDSSGDEDVSKTETKPSATEIRWSHIDTCG